MCRSLVCKRCRKAEIIGTHKLKTYASMHTHHCKQVDSITIPVGPRLGSKVIESRGLSKAFGDRVRCVLVVSLVVLSCQQYLIAQ